MLKGLCCASLFLLGTVSLRGEAKPSEAIASELSKGDFKTAISVGLGLLPKVQGREKSALQAQLAVAYAKDQELESAFSIFLDALDAAPRVAPTVVDPEEERLFEEALALYLKQQGPLAHRAAKEIHADYGPVVKVYPNNYLLGFIVAAAYANLLHFEEFFPLFYESYQRYPDHFLAYKTKALLNLKLWQRGRIPGQREELRQRIKENTMQAIQRYASDGSLYKMAIAFSTDEEKTATVGTCLKNIVQGNIIVPREDILYFVQAAISSGHRDLAQAFVESARTWYKHSRAVEHAQKLIDSQS